MQDRPTLSQGQINRDLLRGVLETRPWFWVALIILSIIVAAAVVAMLNMFWWGLGVTGLNWPTMWAFFITNFVFWVGISHAGVMISSILRLSGAEWRRPVTRAAEVLTVFALSTAALFPFLHTGRPWRTAYWAFPYDFARGVWPDIRSPLIWDPTAVFTYLGGSTMFIFVTLIPDMANLRDRTAGIRKRIYGALSLGWRGTARQWKLQGIAGILLSALILPVFASVHSIVSWDFGMAIVPAWHSTVFAPYFVIGAVLSGVAAVVTMMAVLRWTFHLEDYIRPDHFDALGRLLILVAFAWLYFYMLDTVFSLYSREPQEVAIVEMRLTHWPYSLLTVVFFLTAFVIPVTAWFFRRVRRNIAAMFWVSLLVNVGMWLERFLIIVPGLQYKQPETFVWGAYRPSITEATIVIGSFGLVILELLLFSKIFPIIPVWEQKEGQVVKDTIDVGRAEVPAVIRE